jgi:hypothetical protein
VAQLTGTRVKDMWLKRRDQGRGCVVQLTGQSSICGPADRNQAGGCVVRLTGTRLEGMWPGTGTREEKVHMWPADREQSEGCVAQLTGTWVEDVWPSGQ